VDAAREEQGGALVASLLVAMERGAGASSFLVGRFGGVCSRRVAATLQ